MEAISTSEELAGAQPERASSRGLCGHYFTNRDLLSSQTAGDSLASWELAPPTATLPVHVAPKRVQEPSQDGGSEDAALRRLPPGIEIQRRLGPQYAREFETARVMMGAHISENTDLGRKLANVWLETLRIAGNFSRHRRLSA